MFYVTLYINGFLGERHSIFLPHYKIYFPYRIHASHSIAPGGLYLPKLLLFRSNI